MSFKDQNNLRFLNMKPEGNFSFSIVLRYCFNFSGSYLFVCHSSRVVTETFPCFVNFLSHGPDRYTERPALATNPANQIPFAWQNQIAKAAATRRKSHHLCKPKIARGFKKLQHVSFKFRKRPYRCLEQSLLLFPGVKELKPQQQLVIEQVIRKKCVLGRLPAGFRKEFGLPVGTWCLQINEGLKPCISYQSVDSCIPAIVNNRGPS